MDHFTPTDRILKSPVFQARLLWNNIPPDTCKIENIESFKDVYVNNPYGMNIHRKKLLELLRV